MSRTKTPSAVVQHAGTGLVLPEAIARKIDECSRGLPRGIGYRRIAKTPSEFSLDPGERADISVISTDSVDRDGEVVLPSGIDRTDYNGVVPWAHKYDILPVGRSLWQKPTMNGLKAKTHYPVKPPDWGDAAWMPSAILHLMQNGTCSAKSVGFIPTTVRQATPQEKIQHPEWKDAPVIAQCKLLEYSCCGIPANQDAEAIAVSKAVTKGIESGIFNKQTAELLRNLMSVKTKSTEAPMSSAHVKPPVPVGEACMKMAARVKQQHLSKGGRADAPVIKCMSGLKSVEPTELAKCVKGMGPVQCTMGRTKAMDGEDGSMLQCSVDSPDLDAMHKAMMANMDHDGSSLAPHMPLANVHTAHVKDYEGMDDVDGLSFKAHTLTFSDPDGNETDLALTGGEAKILARRKAADMPHAPAGDNVPPGTNVPVAAERLCALFAPEHAKAGLLAVHQMPDGGLNASLAPHSAVTVDQCKAAVAPMALSFHITPGEGAVQLHPPFGKPAKKDMGGAMAEGTGSGGGFAVSPGDTTQGLVGPNNECTMPECPKCLTSDNVTAMPNKADHYVCSKCEGEFKSKDGIVSDPDDDGDDDLSPEGDTDQDFAGYGAGKMFQKRLKIANGVPVMSYAGDSQRIAQGLIAAAREGNGMRKTYGIAGINSNKGKTLTVHFVGKDRAAQFDVAILCRKLMGRIKVNDPGVANMMEKIKAGDVDDGAFDAAGVIRNEANGDWFLATDDGYTADMTGHWMFPIGTAGKVYRRAVAAAESRAAANKYDDVAAAAKKGMQAMMAGDEQVKAAKDRIEKGFVSEETIEAHIQRQLESPETAEKVMAKVLDLMLLGAGRV